MQYPVNQNSPKKEVFEIDEYSMNRFKGRGSRLQFVESGIEVAMSGGGPYYGHVHDEGEGRPPLLYARKVQCQSHSQCL